MLVALGWTAPHVGVFGATSSVINPSSGGVNISTGLGSDGSYSCSLCRQNVPESFSSDSPAGQSQGHRLAGLELSTVNNQDYPVENQPSAIYDEQLGLTFTQNFTSMAYNVTAVAQSDSNGYGPGYDLDGLTDTGYWYQVGLSWHWPNLVGGYASGFSMNYEVFDPSGNSIYPASGVGLSSFSGTVKQGDTVLLNLFFSGGNVVMQAYDYNTGAGAVKMFNQEGSSVFVGLASSPENSNGFFTGLMTEWWHSSAYYGEEANVTYWENDFAKSSAWMWMEEWVPSTGQTLFVASTSGPVVYTVPKTLQYLSSHNATEASDSYLFITGYSPATVNVNYSVQGGGSGYSPPFFIYYSGGIQHIIQLSTNSTTYYMDSGSPWSVNGLLQGSTSIEIWDTQNKTSGTAPTNGTTLNFVYFHQFRVSFLYAVANGGSGYSQPSMNVSEFGSSVSITPGFLAFVDAGSLYSFQNPLPGSYVNERWATKSPTGMVNSSTLFSATYYHQYRLTSGYTTVGGRGPTAPSLALTQFGSAAAVSLSGSPTAYWSDVGQLWSVSNPLQRSSSVQRWYTQDVTSGTVSAAQSVLFTYYDQYYVLFGFNIMNSNQSGYTAPTVSYTKFGSQSQGVANFTDWTDASSSYSFTGLLSGSNSNTRWMATNETSGTVSGSVVVVPYYFQVAWTLAYSVSGGGSPAVPLLSGLQNGVAFSPTITSIPTAYWFDYGSSWSVTNPLSSSNSSERWITSQTDAGAVSGPTTATFQYYHQFDISVGYVINGGGNPTSPLLSGTAFGVSAAFPINATLSSNWLDAGTSFSLPNPLQGSGSSERWYTNSSSSGSVNAAVSMTLVYYHQYTIVYSYSVSGGGNPGSLELNFSSLGSPSTSLIGVTQGTAWADSGSTFSFASVAYASSNERWSVLAQATTGSVSSAVVLSPFYYHQYYVKVLSNSQQGGFVSPLTDWFNSSEQVQLSAASNGGWQFELWNGSGVGSYGGVSNPFTVTVKDPIVESAAFYPGLSVVSSSFGSVSYSSASLAGKVGGASNRTLFVPLGSTVQLAASPAFFLFKFDGWSGATSSSETEVSVVVNSAESVQASFSINWVYTSILIVIILAVILAVIVILWRVVLPRRKAGKHDRVRIDHPKTS